MESILYQDDELPSSRIKKARVIGLVNKLEKKSYSEEEKAEISCLIKKHPYFKNPCNYQIRLVAIMKYLKRKDVDISLPDADLIIDQLISQIDGVERLEYGRYIRRKS